MADIKGNLSKLYNELSSRGFSGIGENEEEFGKLMGKEENRKKVYDALSSRGYSGIGKDYDEFSGLVYEAPEPAASSVESPAKSAPKVDYQQAVADTVFGKSNVYGGEKQAPAMAETTEVAPEDSGVKRYGPGFIGQAAQGTESLFVQGPRSAAAMAMNTITGTSLDDKAALEDMQAKLTTGGDEFVKKWGALLGSQQEMPKGEKWSTRMQFMKEYEQYYGDMLRDLIANGYSPKEADVIVKRQKKLDEVKIDAAKQAGGDLQGTIDILASNAESKTAGDRILEKVEKRKEEKYSDPEGVGGFLGNLIPSTIGTLASVAATYSGNPVLGRILGAANLGTMSVGTAGLTYQEAMESGASHGQALAAAISDGVIELGTEAIPFSRYYKRVGAGQKAKMAKELTEALDTPAGKKEMEELLKKANKELGGKLFNGKNLKEYGIDVLAESSSEFVAEALESITPMIYEHPDNYPTLGEVVRNGAMGALGGAIMGGFLGGVSKTAEHRLNAGRRKEQGYVDVAVIDDRKQEDAEGNIVEIVGLDPNTGNYMTLQDGKIFSVPKENILQMQRFSYDDFEKGRIEYEADNAFDKGYNLTDSKEKTFARNMVDMRRTLAAQALGMKPEEVEALTLDDVVAMTDDSKKQAVLNFISARSVYDGIVQKVRDDIQSSVDESNRQIDLNTNTETGKVQSATLKGGEVVNILRGQVALTPSADGSSMLIDKDNSSSDIYVRTENGQVKMVSIGDISTVGEEVDAALMKQQEEQRITDAMATSAGNEIDDAVSVNPGEQVFFNGQQATVVSSDEQGNVLLDTGVVDEKGNPVQVTTTIEALQADRDAINMAEAEARLAQEDANTAQENAPAAYQLNDKILARTAAGDVHGYIVESPDENGAYTVMFDTAVDGAQIHYYTAEELANMVLELNGEKVDGPAKIAKDAEPEAPAAVAETPVEQEVTTEEVQQAEPEPEQPKKAIDRIPLDGKTGKRNYDVAPVEDVWQALVEQNEGDEAEAADTIERVLDIAKKQLTKAQNVTPKGNDPDEIQASKASKAQAVAAAQAKVDHWEAVKAHGQQAVEQTRLSNLSVPGLTARQEDLTTPFGDEISPAFSIAKQISEMDDTDLATEVEDTLVQIEQAEKSEDAKKSPEYAARLEEQRKIYEELQDRIRQAESAAPLYTPAVSEEKVSSEPVNAKELVAHMLMKGDAGKPMKIDLASFRNETGYGAKDMRGFVGMFRKQGGKTINQLAERLIEMKNEGYDVNFNDEDARNIILDFFHEVRTNNDVRRYIQRNHKTEANAAVEQQNSDVEAAIMNDYGMTPEEYNEAVLQARRNAVLNALEGNGNVQEEVNALMNEARKDSANNLYSKTEDTAQDKSEEDDVWEKMFKAMQEWAQSAPGKRAIASRAASWATRLGGRVQFLTDESQIKDRSALQEIKKGQRVRGWYSPESGVSYVFLPNIISPAEIDEVVQHETIQHQGVRELLDAANGKGAYKSFCEWVYDNTMTDAEREHFDEYVGNKGKEQAADEFLAHIAENYDIHTNGSTWDKIVGKIRDILGIKRKDDTFRQLLIDSYKNQVLKTDAGKAYGEAQKVMGYAEGEQSTEDIREELEDSGLITDKQGDVQFSLAYSPNSKEEIDRTVKDIALLSGVSERQARKWLKSELSIASLVRDINNAPYLDYEADDREKAIKDDSDYPQGTVDFNNICRKRIAFTYIYSRLQKANPNRIITGEDLANIRQIMMDDKLMVACGLCYVEDRRQLLGEIAQDFIDNVKGNFAEYESRKTEKGEESVTKKNNAKKFRKLIGDDVKEDLNIYDLITLEGSTKLFNEHRGIYDAFIAFNSARGQQAGNLFKGYAEYKREIMGWNEKKVEKVNNNGGLRVFSYSDFEAHHLIDLVQIIIDCAAKGVKIQGYTKVPEFARAVANTGIKLNRSLIPLGDSGLVHADGSKVTAKELKAGKIEDARLAYDPVEGIDINDENFLESNDNIGNILIGINDEQIRMAMADPFVHYIIPYHSNQSKKLRKLKQTGEWKNYKNEQTDKGEGAGKHGVNIYTDILNAAESEGKPIRTERQFVERFLSICREHGWKPRFARFLDTDAQGNYKYTPGYYKLLLDFKLFDEKGRILPQMPVVPEFDNEFNKQILDDYVRGEKAQTGADINATYKKIAAKLNMNESLPDDGLMLSKVNDNQRVFISNAEQAVEGLNMGKASGENWIKAIQGRGGLKAAEDKWLGLSDWLKEQEGQVSKEDVLKFIAENRIRLGEKRYGMELPEMKESVMQGQVMFSKVDGIIIGEKQSGEVADAIIDHMHKYASPAIIKDFSKENWAEDFPNGEAETPIGKVKLGEHQYIKMNVGDNGERKNHFGLSSETLTHPDVILERNAPKEGAERQSKYLFIKSFKKEEKGFYYFEHVTVQKDSREVSISGHNINRSDVKSALIKDKLLWSRFASENTPSDEEQRDTNSSAIYPSEENRGANLQSSFTNGKDTNSSEYSNKFSKITPEQDKAYMEAVNNGDMETAGKMVRDAASKKGYVIKSFHGSPEEKIKRFKKGKHGYLGPAIYLSLEDEYARRYARKYGDGRVYELFASIHNPLKVTTVDPGREILNEAYGKDGIFEKRLDKQGNYSWLITSGDLNRLQNKGYDAIIWDYAGETEIAVFNPNQIKSAEPVTFDDNGEIIPLSKRFNPEKDDIRFSFIGVKGFIRTAKSPEEKAAMWENVNAAMKAFKNPNLTKEDRKRIKLATGFEQGADGKMRYEIPDFVMKEGDAGVFRKGEDEYETKTLGSIFKNSNAIFTSYPELKYVNVIVKKFDKDVRGTMNSSGTRLELNEDLLEDVNGGKRIGDGIMPTIIHEVQHFIQNEEGWAKGGSVRDFISNGFNLSQEQMGEIMAQVDFAMSLPDNMTTDEILAMYRATDKAEKMKRATLAELYQSSSDGYTVQDYRNTLKADLDRLMNEQVKAIVEYPDAVKKYKALAGEVEARNAAKRHSMSEEQRQNTLAEETEDIARDDQTIRFSKEDAGKVFEAAKKEFGMTTDFREAGFILPDGAMLDFSEKKDGGPAGKRSLDHRAIGRVLEGAYETQTDKLTAFLNTGAIRVMPEIDAINFSQPFSEEQRSAVRRFIGRKNGEVIIDISDERGNTDGYMEYDRWTPTDRIMRDIDDHFAGAKLDEDSDGVMFSKRTKPAPKKTIPVYKLMRLVDGKLYPLYIDRNAMPIELNVWYDADAPSFKDIENLAEGFAYKLDAEGNVIEKKAIGKGEKGNITGLPSKGMVDGLPAGQRWIAISTYADGEKSYYNVGINGADGVSVYAMRPGWHAGKLPSMWQIGKGAKKNLRDDSFVWVRGKMAADHEFVQGDEGMTKAGDMPTKMPIDGFYAFMTNPKQSAEKSAKKAAEKRGETYRGNDWYVSGAFMPEEIISDSEARRVIDEYNKENRTAVPYDFARESGMDFNAGTMSLEPALFSKLSSDELRKRAAGISKGDYYKMTEDIYFGLSEQERGKIVDAAMKNGLDFDKATADYLAGLQDVWEPTDEQKAIYDKARKVFGQDLSDDEVRYLLWKVTRPENGAFGVAEDVVMQKNLSVGDYKENDIRFSKFSIFDRNEKRRNQTDDNGSAERENGTGMAENNARRVGAKYTLGDTGVFEEELAAQRSRYSDADSTNYIEDVPEIRFSKKTPLSPAQRKYEEKTRIVNEDGKKSATANFRNRWKEAYLDSMKSLKELQDAIIEETGGEILDKENAYIAENAMSSKIKDHAEEYTRDYYMPIIGQVKGLMQQGASYIDILDYMIAKHGLERNEKMRSEAEQKAQDEYETAIDALNASDLSIEEMADKRSELLASYQSALEKADRDYSGLSELTGEEEGYNEKARELVEMFEDRFSGMDSFWETVNTATKQTLKTAYEAGLMTKENYENVRDMYRYYVPLRGHREGQVSDIYDYFTSDKALREKTIKTAKGRISVADDPIAMIAVMGGDGIAQAERNLMKQKLLHFVMNHPTALATIKKQWYVIDPISGGLVPANPEIDADATPQQINNALQEFEEKMALLEKEGKATTKRGKLKLAKFTPIPEGHEHEIHVRQGGVEYVIYVNGTPRAAQAVNGILAPEQINFHVKEIAGKLKNFMAQMFTSKNPAFIFTNGARDIIWAGQAVGIKESKEYKAQYTRNMTRAFFRGQLLGLVHRANNGTLDMNSELDRYFNEFLRNGGETGFTALNTIEDYKKDLTKLEKELAANTAFDKGWNLTKKGWNAIWDSVEFMNRAVEDMTRFCVYMTSRQQGRSIARSVYDAKEITVNFNKKGSGMMGQRWLNFGFIFFNAGMQALNNIGKLWSTNKVGVGTTAGKFMVGGMVLPLAVLALQAALRGDRDDDDDEVSYWDLPEWVRRNNIVLWVPGTKKTYITIPLPHELRPLYGMGEAALSAMLGKEDPEDAVKKAAEGFTNIVPIDFTGNAGDMVVNLTPTFAQPFVQWERNVDFFGKPIFKKSEFNKLDPNWKKAYKGTNAILVDGTKKISEMTQSNPDLKGIRPGVVDLNPAVLEHLAESYLGGVGKTINQIYKTISMVWDDDARQMRNVPVASSFIQQVDEKSQGSQLGREYYSFLDEYKKTEHALSGLRAAAKENGGENMAVYQQKAASFAESEEYKRYLAGKNYVNRIDNLNSKMKYLKEDEREEYRKEIVRLKKQLLARLAEMDNNK